MSRKPGFLVAIIALAALVCALAPAGAAEPAITPAQSPIDLHAANRNGQCIPLWLDRPEVVCPDGRRALAAVLARTVPVGDATATEYELLINSPEGQWEGCDIASLSFTLPEWWRSGAGERRDEVLIEGPGHCAFKFHGIRVGNAFGEEMEITSGVRVGTAEAPANRVLLGLEGDLVFPLALSFTLAEASAPAGATKGQSLSKFLNPDGTLNLPPGGIIGSIDPSGFRMEGGSEDPLRFVPESAGPGPLMAGDEYWDTRFNLRGMNDAVRALAWDGTNLYAGGDFTTAGGAAANYIAKYDGTTWSALGTGMNQRVYALAWDGTNLYAGGSFTTAGGGAANYIARWNGTSWSSLGTGMNSAVLALYWRAASSSLYAGGSFTTAGGVTVNRVARWNSGAWTALGTSPNQGTNGTVNALAGDATYLYVGGIFTTAGGLSHQYLARWNGTVWSGWGSLFTGGGVLALVSDGTNLYVGGQFTTPGVRIARFNGSSWSGLGSGMDNSVRAVAWDGTYLYAGGDFTTVNGGPASRIARFDGGGWSPLGAGTNSGVSALAVGGTNLYVGGALATRWAGGVYVNRVAKWTGSEWSELPESGWGMNGTVYALAWDGTNLYAGGQFTTAGGVAANYVARWSPGSGWGPLGAGIDNTVRALAWDGANLYAGGQFSTAGGVSANYIAKWDGSAWSALGSGMNGVVYALCAQGGQIYAGGQFTTAGGVTVNRVARWNGTAWSALGTGTVGVGGTVYALVISSGGYLYAGGNFWTAGGAAANCVARYYSGAWSALGSGLDSTVYALALDGSGIYAGGLFTNYISRFNGTAWLPSGGFNGYVQALAWDGTRLYAGGQFTTAGGTTVNYVTSYSGGSWSALGTTGTDNFVYALASSGTRLFVGGSFTVAGTLSTKRLALWDGSGWRNVLEFGCGLDNTVSALAMGGNNLYAGGNFTATGDGMTATRWAMWDGGLWNILSTTGAGAVVNAMAWSGSILYAGGVFTSPANYVAQWSGSAWSAMGTGMNAAVNALTYGGTNLYAGGAFTTAGGVTANCIAKWNGSAWSALGAGAGMNGAVNALAWDGTNLYAGGAFTTADGTAVNYVARWNGTSWSALGSGMNGAVNALAWDGTNLYAGGAFTTAGGVAANYIARWNGSSWIALGTGMDAAVNALAWSGGDLYAGGVFQYAGGTLAKNIAKWNGSAWSGLGQGTNGTVSALAWDGTGLYVGGAFTTAGGKPSSYIGRWCGPPSPPTGLVATTNRCNDVQVTWNSAYGATSYTLYRGTTCWPPVDTFAGVTSPYTDTTAVAGTTYYYWIAATGPCGTGDNSLCATGMRAVTPSAPTTTGASRCGTGTVTLNASGAGGGQDYKWYDAASGGTLLQTNGPSYTTPSISTTTTYYVSLYDTTSLCESSRTAVTATVNPNPLAGISAGGPTTVCPGGSVQLTAYSNIRGDGTQASNAISLNGVNQFVKTPDTQSAFPTETLTIEVWFKATAGGGGGVIIDETDNGGGWHDSFIEMQANGEVRVRVWFLSYVSLGTASFGQWNHAVIRYDKAARKLDGILNGVPSATSVTGDRLAPWGGGEQWGFGLGDTTNLGNGNYFNGQIDEVRIWNTARTDQQILENMFAPIGSAQPGLVALYRMSESSGTTAYDSSGNNFHAQVFNGAAFVSSGAPVGPSTASYTWSPPQGLSSTTGATVTASPSSTTTYTVVATDPVTGCASTADITVVVTPKPSASITPGGPTTFCAGGSVELAAAPSGGTGPYTYLWSPGNETTQSITVAVSGTYSVIVTDANSCASDPSGGVAVTVNQQPIPVITGPASVCAGGSVTLDAGVGYVSYLWSPGGETTQSITISPAGDTTYTVTVTDGNGCSGTSAGHTVTVNPLPAPTITGPTSVCTGGSVTLDAGAGYASYLWSPGGATTQSITVSPTSDTTYTVTVTGVNGCPGTSAGHTVTVNPLPAPSITGPASVCAGGAVTLDAGVGYSSYLWSPGGATTQSITVSPAGDTTYSVTVTDVNGCSGTSAGHTVTVNQLSAPSITGPASVCAGDSVTLDAGAGYVSYLWSPGGETTQTITVSPAGETTYTVTVTDGNGCSGTSASHTVTVNPLPTPSITGPASVCAGGSVTLDAGVGYVSYLWSPGGATTQSITVSPASDTTYTVTVTDGNGCSGTSAGHVVTVNPLPAPSITGPASVCAGGSVTLDAGVGYVSYRWSPGGETTQAITVSPTSDTTYTVTVTGVNGCPGTSAGHTVTVNPLPAVTGVTLQASSGSPGPPWSYPVGGGFAGGFTMCVDAAVPFYYLDVDALTSAAPLLAAHANPFHLDQAGLPQAFWDYWDAKGVNSGAEPGTWQAVMYQIITGAQPMFYIYDDAGDYRLIDGLQYLVSGGTILNPLRVSGDYPQWNYRYTGNVTGQNGCDSADFAVLFAFNPIPAAPAAGNGGPVCAGSTLNLTASDVPGGSYAWTGPNGFTSNLQNPSIPNATTAATGTYSVTVTVSGCESPAGTTEATVNAVPTSPTAGNDCPICAGGTLNLTASTIPGATYAWTGPNGFTSTEQNPSITGATNYASGTYSVTATVDGCTSTAGTTEATVNALPTPAITGPTSVCAGGSVTLDAGPGYVSYLWSPGGATTQSITVSPIGDTTYTVTVTDNNGCPGTSAGHIVTVNPLPTPSITGPASVCAGGSVTLGAGVGYVSYLWSPGGETTQTITVSPAGDTTYTVTVTDNNGCTGTSAGHIVTVNPLPTPSITGPASVCAGDSVTLNAGVGYVSYLWSPGGETAQTITVSPAGDTTYTVTVTDGNGCSGTSAGHIVTVNPLPTPSITGPTSVCAGNSVTLNAGVGYSSYLWSPGGATTQSITVSPASDTTYTVTVTDGNGCTGTSLGHTVTVNICVLPEVSATGATYPARLVADGSSPTGYFIYFQQVSAAGGYNLYEGTIGTYYSHGNQLGNLCDITSVDVGGGLMRADITPSPGDHYYLVTAFAPGVEGPSGFSFPANLEIDPAQSTCP